MSAFPIPPVLWRHSGRTECEQRAGPFALVASPNLPGAPLVFHIGHRGERRNLRLPPPPAVHAMPSTSGGPIGPDPYGYYCYDDTDTLTGRAPAFDWLELAPPGPGALISGITDRDAGLARWTCPSPSSYYGSRLQSDYGGFERVCLFGAPVARERTTATYPALIQRPTGT